MRFVLATDVGGTCTDTVVVAEDGAIHLGKALSTPPEFADGIIHSIESAAQGMGLGRADLLARTTLVLHGCTVVDNTLLTLDGARTGLITTEGFEDTLRVTRGAYGRWSGLPEDRIKHPVATNRPDPLVPRDRIEGIPERVDCQGVVLRALDETATEAAIRRLVQEHGVEALAVCLLWSFYNPEHERRVKALVERVAPGVYVTVSSEIAPVPGEYERTSTTVINAYAGRVIRDYLANLQQLLTAEGYTGPLLVMQGHGGLLPAVEAGERAVGMIECGPVAGLIGSRFLGDLTAERSIIAADMGGTTFKVGVIQDGMLEYAREPMVNRYHYVAPKIEVVSIGAGGGSIVSLEPGTQVPRVGPRSAGARPGPVCYRQGGAEPTLTDVMLLVGYMDEEHFLGGSLTLDSAAARRVFAEQIATPLGMSVEEAAFGICRVAAAQATDLIHEITVERGLDPREFVLHAFGGTCPMLAALFAQELRVRHVVVPYTASVNGAFGLATADVVHEYATTTTRVMPAPAGDINALFVPMVAAAQRALAREGFASERLAIEWSVGMRYGRQVHEIVTPVRADQPLDEAGLAMLVNDFEQLYERRYGKGSAYREAGVELTQFRVTARGRMARPALTPAPLTGARSAHARIGTRPIFVEARGGFRAAGIYDFLRLAPGNVVRGPAVIHTPVTTIVIQERQTGRLDAFRNVIIEFG